MTVQTTITVMDSMPEPVVRPQHVFLLRGRSVAYRYDSVRMYSTVLLFMCHVM